MPICITQPLHHVNDRLHTAPPPLRRRPTCPTRLNLGTYYIWYGCIFGLLQEFRAVQLGNYNVMLLTETKIPDEVYCKYCIGYYNMCSRATLNMVGVA